MATKSFKKKLIKAIKSPKGALQYIFYKFIILFKPIITDKLYLKLLFFNRMGYWFNFKTPKTFSEKLNWLKLYDHNPEYTIMVDKVKAKEWVAERIGKEHIIPTLGVWEKAKDIDFDSLPDKFVIKCNHNSGSIFICKDKSKLDKNLVRKELAKGLRRDYYKYGFEWPYKNIQKRILAETFLEDKNNLNTDLTDYKFFCFNGEPLFCQVIRDRSSEETIDIFDMQWNLQKFNGLNPVAKNGLNPVAKNGLNPVAKPLKLEDMINICRKLSKGISFIRVDLYVLDNKIYFGELTFYPFAGFGEFNPKKWNVIIGDMIVLPQKV